MNLRVLWNLDRCRRLILLLWCLLGVGNLIGALPPPTGMEYGSRYLL